MTRFGSFRILPMLVVLAAALGLQASSSQSHGPDRSRIDGLAAVEVLAGTFGEPMGVAIESSGAILVADRRHGAVYAVGADGVQARLTGLAGPVGLAVDADGRLLIVEEKAGRLVALDGGSVAVLARRMRLPRWVATADDGTVYLSARGLKRDHGHWSRYGHDDEDDDEDENGNDGERDSDGEVILRLPPGGQLAVWADGFEGLEGLVIRGDTVLAAARGRTHVRRDHGGVFRIPVEPDGSAGPVTRLSPSFLEKPVGLALDRLGALYASAGRLDLPGTPERAIGKIAPDGSLTRFAWRLERPRGMALDGAGHLYVADGTGRSGRVLRFEAPPPPDVATPVPGQNPLLLTGHTEPRARVDVAVNDDARFAAIAAPDGGFALAIPLPAGAASALAVSATAHEGRGLTSAAAELTIVPHDGIAPQITGLQPANGAFRNTPQPAIGASFSDPGGAVDPASAVVRLDGVNVTALAQVTPAGFTLTPPPLAEGGHTLFVQVADQAGNVASASAAFVVDLTGPSVTGVSPADGTTVTVPRPPIGAGFADAGAGVDVASVRVGLDGVDRTGEATLSATGFSLDPGDLAPGAHALAITLGDLAGNVTTVVASFTVAIVPGGSLPPDPATVAPPLDPTTTATVASATAFLYSGANPIQTGVAPGTIEPRRAAVVRGRVLDRAGAPLPGVTVRLPSQPELGQTLSRADGMFDLAVNGGGALTIRYERDGFLPSERRVETATQDYFWLPDVVLVALDPQATVVDLASSAPIQVARGSVSTDADGARQATLLFAQGTTARLRFGSSGSVPLGALTVRATEYTVGPGGPAAMPGPLPPSSAYTYAVELSVDEAIAAGADEVQFSQPVMLYVENFLNFPVGGLVPAGFYDRGAGAWRASDNGRVIAVLGVTAGLADIDGDGDGLPDDVLGIAEAERRQIATLYQPGQSLWRVPITHFSAWDCNWPFGPPDDADDPNQDRPRGGGPEDECCENQGSIIEAQNQILGERIDVAGTPFSLNYRSDRVPGRTVGNVLDIALSGPMVPASLRRIQLEILVAGRRIQQTFPAAPDQRHTFVWDARDTYGRPLQGVQPATIRIGYVFGGVRYQEPGQGGRTFARFGSRGDIIGDLARQELFFWQEFRAKVGSFDARIQALGGWTLDVHHAYDPLGQVVSLGDGGRRSAQRALAEVIQSTPLGGSLGLAVTPDGTLYGSRRNHVVTRVTPAGDVSTIAGRGIASCNGPATSTDHGLNNPAGLAPGPADVVDVTSLDDFGNPVVRRTNRPVLYIADRGCHQVHHLRPDGGFHFIATIVGDGIPGFERVPGIGGDDVHVSAARLNNPTGLAVGRDGSLYIVDTGNSRVRRVEPAENGFLLNGIITTVAGTATPGFSGDGGMATSAQLNAPSYLAIGEDGSLYIADTGNHRVRRVSPSGIITTFAGTGIRGFSGDDGLATDAQLDSPRGLAWSSDGLYIVDGGNRRVRRVSPGGVIETVAGGGFGRGDGGSPTQAALVNPFALAFAPDRSLLVTDDGGTRVVGSALPFFTAFDISIPSADGLELYRFDGTGRHLETRHALTGGIVYGFGYDSADRLVSVTDGDGNVTAIERDGAGTPTAIVAPFGQRTALVVDGDGYLTSVTGPATAPRPFTYHGSGGLLATHADPRGGIHQYTFDPQGVLVADEDPDHLVTTLAREELPTGYRVTRTTPPGRVTTHLVDNLAGGAQRRIDTAPGGATIEHRLEADGSQELVLPDGMRISQVDGPDPRFGMSAPVLTSRTVTTPGGLTSSLTATRAATLADPLNPLSVQTLVTTLTVNGRPYTSTFDAASRTITETTPAGRQVVTTVDVQGRPVRKQLIGLAPVAYTYDDRGRLATVTVGTGAQADAFTVTYGADGYPASLLDPLGQVVASLQHDGAGRLTRKTVSDGGETLAGYDGNDNLAAVTPPGRPAHTLTHTPGDRLAGYAPPDVGAGNPGTAYAYGPDGELVTITRPDGQIVSIAYDPAGRPSTITSAAGPMTYVYNPASGQLATVTAPGGVTLAYTYDGALVTGETLAGPVSGTVARAHDADFRLLFETVAGTSFVSFGYDPDGLPLQAGALILRRHPQHGLVTGTTLGVVEDEWTHADDAEEASQRVTAQGVELYRVERVRDRRGRISQTTETIGGVTEVSDYAYDGVGRLTEVRRSGLPVATYAYDRNGNRLSVIRPSGTVTATYDAQDRLEQHGGVTYTYTRAGDLLTRTAGAQTTTYGYDAFGSLRHVTLADGRMLDYVIDGRGRRVGKRINGVLVQGFLYRDDLSPIAELDGAGALVSRFVYASERNVPDYLERGGQTYRIVSDPLGSPRLVVDATTGAIVQRLDYDEFGNVVLDTNPGFQPFGFAGGLYDRDTRLVRFGARDYDPETGRWTAKDPIGFDGGDTNLYAYALNDPLNLTDPSGRVAQIIIGVLVGGGVDLALQLAGNGGNFDCVNWGEVALNAALGGATGGLNHLRTLRAAKQALTIEKELNAARRATRLAEMERNALKGIKAGDKVEVVKLPGQASTRPNIGNQTGRGTLGTNSQGGGASGSGRR